MGLVALTRADRRVRDRAEPVRDYLLVGGLALALVSVTALPYLFAYAVAGSDHQFMGIVLNVPDTAQYYSWARESMHSVFIENKLTPERGAAVFFNLFWWCIGRLAAVTHLGIAETTQLIRPLVGMLYISAIYWVIGLAAHDRRERWTAALVAILGGGLGWLLVAGKQFTGELASPLDVYITEANTFLTVMAFPHQAMAGALQIAALGLGALAFERRSGRLAALAGLAGVLLGVQHGYDLLIVYVVTGGLGLLLSLRDGSWLRNIGLGALICAPSMPVALYLALLTSRSPIWRGVLAQYGNAGVYTPTPPHLLVLMGIPLLVLLAGLPLLVRRRAHVRRWFATASAPDLLMWTWLVLGFLLLYIPTDFQIKMLACWQVPVGLAATRVILGWSLPLVPTLLVLAVLPVNIYLFTWRFVDLGRVSQPYYLTRDEIAALQWLDTNSTPRDVVLSSEKLGQYVPSASGNSAFLAHWAETLDYYTKQRLVRQFFEPTSTDLDRAAILDAYDVRYVLVAGEPLAPFARLQPVYSSPGATVYFVRAAS
jgi:hypothetical protein